MDTKLVFMKTGMKNPISIPLETIETRKKVAFRAAFLSVLRPPGYAGMSRRALALSKIKELL